jgi:hypothetical protein
MIRLSLTTRVAETRSSSKYTTCVIQDLTAFFFVVLRPTAKKRLCFALIQELRSHQYWEISFHVA